MDAYDYRFYGLTRRLMIFLGLWPYQNPKYRKLLLVFVSIIYMKSLLIQLATFITHEYNTTLLIEVSAFVFLCIIYTLKYQIVYFNSYHIKKLLDYIQRDWNLIKDTNELKIIQKYAYKARFYTVFSGLIVYPGTSIFISMIFVPDILNILMPLDKPRPRQLPVQVEVFFDIENYFYVFFLFYITVVFLGMTILMATETMYMAFIQHACGLFELVSCRLTYALNTNLSGTTLLKTKCKLCTKLLHAFLAHQHCLKFIKIVQYEFSTSYFVLCVLGVASLSINMFRFFYAIEIHNIIDIISTGLFVFAHFCYIFYMNYFGQDLIDQSECFFQQIYNAQWYTAPICAQKLLFIALQRSAKTSKIIIGSLFVASFEGFATLTSMSLSYCMVIYSVRT